MMNSLFVYSQELTRETFDKFRELIYREMGVYMRESKRILVSNRLRKRLIALNMKSYDDYYRFLIGGEGRKELVHFIDAVSTNETYFYRGEGQFKAMEEVVLPELYGRRRSGGVVKVWSAGCSSGEEAYTIGIVMEEARRREGWGGEVEIVATDINTEMIEKARDGIYSGRTMNFVPKDIRNLYFESIGEGEYRVGEVVREKIRFKVHNLLKDEPPGYRFDLIFCRNVMIYFDKKVQKQVVNGIFADVLIPDGYLFIGYSESLFGISENFKYIQLMKSPIYRLLKHE